MQSVAHRRPSYAPSNMPSLSLQFKHCFNKAAVATIEKLGLLHDEVWVLVRGYKERKAKLSEAVEKISAPNAASRARLRAVLSAAETNDDAFKDDQELLAFGGAIDADGRNLVASTFEPAGKYQLLREYLCDDSRKLLLDNRWAPLLPRDPLLPAMHPRPLTSLQNYGDIRLPEGGAPIVVRGGVFTKNMVHTGIQYAAAAPIAAPNLLFISDLSVYTCVVPLAFRHPRPLRPAHPPASRCSHVLRALYCAGTVCRAVDLWLVPSSCTMRQLTSSPWLAGPS